MSEEDRLTDLVRHSGHVMFSYLIQYQISIQSYNKKLMQQDNIDRHTWLRDPQGFPDPRQTNIGIVQMEEENQLSFKDGSGAALSLIHKQDCALTLSQQLTNHTNLQVEALSNKLTQLSLTEQNSESTIVQMPLEDTQIKEESLSEKPFKTKKKTIKKAHVEKTVVKSSKNKSKTEGKKKRKDDNNNAHKKMITVLNTTLSACGMLSKIKKELKKEGIEFQKGSRYSFTCRLIDAQRLFSPKKFKESLIKYCESLEKVFQLPEEVTDSAKLLNSLVKYYKKSCELFAEGKIEESTEAIFDIPNAKEKKYKEEGIEKVKEYMAKRFPQ